jgi:hypothetical protein
VIKLGTKDDVVTLVLNPSMLTKIPSTTLRAVDSLRAEMRAGRFTTPGSQ